MANIIATLVAELSANTTKFVSGMEKANKSIRDVKSELSLIKFDSIVNLGERAYRAGEQVYNFAKSIASSLNDIDRQAKVLGMSTDQLQKWQYASKMSDVGAQTLATGFKFLSKNMSEASQGTGSAYDAFKAMGLEFTDVTGKLKPLDRMMLDIMDKFAEWSDGPEKIALSMAIFGRSGEALIPFLNKGSAGFNELAREAEKFGIVLREDLISGGGEAENQFKKLESQINSLKLSLAPAATGFVGFFADIVKDAQGAIGAIEGVVEALSKASKKGMESQEEWRKKRGYPETNIGEELGLKTPDWKKAIRDAEDYYLKLEEFYNRLARKPAPGIQTEAQRKQIGEMKSLISEFGWEDYAAGAELASEAERKLNQMLIQTQGAVEALENAFRGMGIESSASLKSGIDMAVYNLNLIEKAYKSGKVSVLDYANAVKSLTEKLKGVTGADTFNQLNDAMDQYLEKVKQLNEQYPERGQEYQKALSKAVDDWLKKKSEIEEKDPVFVRANLSKWEDDLRMMREKYYRDKALIEANPISIGGGGGGGGGGSISGYASSRGIIMPGMSGYKEAIDRTTSSTAVAASGGGGGGGGSSRWTTSLMPGMSGYEGAMEKYLESGNILNIPVNYDLTATGMSPKMPLGDALRKLGDKFGGIENLISGLEAEISFDKTTYQLNQLEKEMEKYKRVEANWLSILSNPYVSPESKLFGFAPELREKLSSLMEDVGVKIDILKKEQALDILQGYVGSYQFGTPYVSKTGFALVHEGEKIISKNQTTNMGGVTIYVSGAGDPKKVADEIGRVLKYRLSGGLEEGIRGILR